MIHSIGIMSKAKLYISAVFFMYCKKSICLWRFTKTFLFVPSPHETSFTKTLKYRSYSLFNARFSMRLRRKDAVMLNELMTQFERCYNPAPHSVETSTVWNFSSWFCTNAIQQHSRPHVFKFIMVNDKPRIYYKKWTTDKVCLFVVLSPFWLQMRYIETTH